MTKLSILIATLGERKDRFTALVDKLVSQANDDVEIIAYFNNSGYTLDDYPYGVEYSGLRPGEKLEERLDW